MDIYFSGCQVDLNKPDLVNKFKLLNPELDKPFGLNQVSDIALVKFIVATYDINSPFVEKYSDWAQRRRETARFADLPKTGKFYIEEAEQIILGKNSTVNHLMLWYMFCQNDMEFIKLQAYQAMYYRQIKASMETEFDKPSDYEKLKQNIENLSNEIKSLQRLIFSGEESEGLKVSLYNFITKISTDFTPEDRAIRVQDGEPVVDESPYGDYTPKEMKFIGDA